MQFGIEPCLTSFIRRVEHLEQRMKPRPEIAAVLPRAFPDIGLENIAGLKDARIIGEKAKEKPDKKPLQIVPVVAGRL